MTKPIEYREVVRGYVDRFPNEVFEVFNDLIVKHWDGSEALVKQNIAVEELIKRGLSRDIVFKKHYLDIEKKYEEYGWAVQYKKPHYYEDWDAYFTFRPKEVDDEDEG